MGSDGAILPFHGTEEVEEFLRSATVVENDRLKGGSTDKQKLLLDRDGVRAQAVFRYVDLAKNVHRGDGRTIRFFRDSYRSELAAYRLGAKTVLLPKANEKDLTEIPEDVTADMTFRLVETLEEVLKIALVDPLPVIAPAKAEGGKPIVEKHTPGSTVN